VPRPLSGSDRGAGNVALRLAHRRPARVRPSRHPLPCRPALRHQPHKAARTADPEPDRTAAHREPRRCRTPAPAAADARRVRGIATEQRAMKNYAGHRLSPWLAHLMVSRQETARPLLTPGEVMQLPLADEIIMVAGLPPIRAKKIRYYEDRAFRDRSQPAPTLPASGVYPDRPKSRPDDWTGLRILADASR